jgi:lysylphosphatidylglycerol synthetase-like protein (DUF2156 family)
MEETNFVLLWKEHYEKIDQSLAINKQLLKEATSIKVQSAIRSLVRLKAWGIVALVIWVSLLSLVLFYAITLYSSSVNYFIVSIGVIFIINIKALYDYIKHLVWIKNIDYDGPITEIQQKLTRLQLSIFKHARLMVLQLPFWTTFYLSDRWFPQSVGWAYVVFQVMITASFTWLAYWLYKNQTIENAHKKWLKTLIAGSGGQSVMKALEFYKDLEKFKEVK